MNDLHSIEVSGHCLELLRLQPAASAARGGPPIVLLHEGLGSISMWRDFPQRLCAASGCEVIAYSRAGYGRSSAMTLPRTVDYMHTEGQTVLPQLLAALQLPQAPLLFGHSDGGSIALLCAGGSPVRLAGAVVLAPHVLVEEITLAGIRRTGEMWQQSGALRERLARHHNDVDTVFSSWYDIWLSAPFRDWNIESFLPAIRVPVLAIQGEQDEYATMTQIDRIAAQSGAAVQLLKLDQCGHSPHRDQAQAVLEATTAFIAGLEEDAQV